MARITWNNPITGEKAQFIADTLNESLFNYAFDSNKVPSLNLHFFCMDYLSTSNLVEEQIINEGNLLPLNEELEYLLKESIWLPYEGNGTLMSFRNKQGYHKNIFNEKNIELKTKSDYYQETAKYLIGLLEADEDYCVLLQKRIKEILQLPTFSIKEKKELYFCVREYLTELINHGYSKEYLYNATRRKLFKRKTVNDDIKFIMDFLIGLISEEQKYTVIFGVSDDVYNEFKDLLEGIRPAKPEEKNKLSCDYLKESVRKAVDPVSALERAKRSLLSIINIHNACIHNCAMEIKEKGLVKGESATQYVLINDSLNLLTKNPSKTKEERIEWTKIAVKKKISSPILNALALHNNALNIDESQTQLLSLWSIIEVLVDTKQKYMSRSTYITNVLCSILCNNYYYQVLQVLYEQIRKTSGINSIIQGESRGNTELEKFAYILKDNQIAQNALKSALDCFPLEKYKIELFSEIFSSKEKMQANLIRHSNRLRWQIMRIYRNRCMIVHNGSSFPYIDNILENLHYYVDQLIDYVFSKIKIGIGDLDAIFSCARIKEGKNMEILGDKKVPLSDAEYYNIIFEY